MLIASGKQPPCAAETGVDVQAGAVKRMNAAACQLHHAWFQHADCTGCRPLHSIIIHSRIPLFFHAFCHLFMQFPHIQGKQSFNHHSLMPFVVLSCIQSLIHAYCELVHTCSSPSLMHACIHSSLYNVCIHSVLQHMCCPGVWSVKHPETR